MTVWIVRGAWDYEQSQILGVYATQALAEQRVAKEKASAEPYDVVDAYPWEVEKGVNGECPFCKVAPGHQGDCDE